jgi:hypothetical protein
MTKYLAGVLSVIAVGILLIAYGLISPKASAYAPAPFDPLARPMLAGERVSLADDPYAARNGYMPGYVPGFVPVNGYAPAVQYGPVTGAPAMQTRSAAPVRAVSTQPVRARSTSVEREPGRNWQKTALVIGGTTAAGAGVGGIFGGKKGALIGAAIGGGTSTLYEAMKK